MCGRASLSKQEKELEERFQATFYQEDIARYNPLPNFNVAPTHWHPVIINQEPDRFRFYKWGLVPPWAQEERIGSKMINARIETLLEKPAFSKPLEQRRCIVPFDGFYEWRKEAHGRKQPYLIGIDDQAVFSVAGLWETWRSPEGKIIPTFTLITMPPNELMQHIHNRMPALLTLEQERLWLADDLSPSELIHLLQPFPSAHMHAFPVSASVNQVTNNEASLIIPIGPELRASGPMPSAEFDLFNQPEEPE